MVGPHLKVGVSRVESVTQPGASWKAQCGGVKGPLVVVIHFVPRAQVPVGAQLAGPGVKALTQPGGSAGAVTPSKYSLRVVSTPHGVGPGDGEGVGVAMGCISNDPMSMRPLNTRR